MKYEDIPRTRRYLLTLGSNLTDITEAIKGARITAETLPQFDSVLESMEIMTQDLQTKLNTLDDELKLLYEQLVDGLIEK